MKKPDRIMVLMFSGVLFMVAATLFGEGTRQEKLVEKPALVVSDDSVPTITPETKPEKASK